MWHKASKNLVNIGSTNSLLSTPGHYLNQCWLIISEVSGYSPESYFTGNSQDIRYLSVIWVLRNIAWWRHQMETFSALLAICVGNSPVTGEFPHKGQWRGALMFSLIWAWKNGWVNNRVTADLRRYRAHYDVIVIDLWLQPMSKVAEAAWCIKVSAKFFRSWLVACPVPSRYLNQCWHIVNWNLRNNFQWIIFFSKYERFYTRKWIQNFRLQNGGLFLVLNVLDTGKCRYAAVQLIVILR